MYWSVSISEHLSRLSGSALIALLFSEFAAFRRPLHTPALLIFSLTNLQICCDSYDEGCKIIFIFIFVTQVGRCRTGYGGINR